MPSSAAQLVSRSMLNEARMMKYSADCAQRIAEAITAGHNLTEGPLKLDFAPDGSLIGFARTIRDDDLAVQTLARQCGDILYRAETNNESVAAIVVATSPGAGDAEDRWDLDELFETLNDPNITTLSLTSLDRLARDANALREIREELVELDVVLDVGGLRLEAGTETEYGIARLASLIDQRERAHASARRARRR